MVEAEIGLTYITGSRDGSPMKVGINLTIGLYVSNSVMAVLVQRGAAAFKPSRIKGYEGPHIDLLLSDCQVAVLSNIASSVLSSGERNSGW